MSPRAAAISAAVGFVDGDSCQRRLRRGVMEILSSVVCPVSAILVYSTGIGMFGLEPVSECQERSPGSKIDLLS